MAYISPQASPTFFYKVSFQPMEMLFIPATLLNSLCRSSSQFSDGDLLIKVKWETKWDQAILIISLERYYASVPILRRPYVLGTHHCGTIFLFSW